MSIRSLISFSALAFSFTSLATMPVSAQSTQSSAPAIKTTQPKPWAPPLTPDGQPDLQGNWVNKSATPLERPAQLEGRQSLTDAEVAELRKRADRIFNADGQSDFPAGDDLFLAALGNIEKYKRTSATGGSDILSEREWDNRTSLIVDPPDGKLPSYTPAGRQRLRALAEATDLQNPPAGPEEMTSFQRCLTWGVPMPRPSNYTSYYQIVQSPGYVVVMMEAVHDARIIPLDRPLDRRAHLPPGIHTWNGDSIGHWEGNTLVVDTTNFSPQDNFMGAAENLHLVERFTRIATDEIRYEFTVDDPTTWTKPWTASLRLKQTPYKIYEFACHEGNQHVIEDMLTAVQRSK